MKGTFAGWHRGTEVEEEAFGAGRLESIRSLSGQHDDWAAGFVRTIAALLIFVFVYAVILAGEKSPRKLDRPSAGLIGAVLMVACGVLSRREAAHAIDFATLALLLGMMLVIHYATESGLLDHLSHSLLSRATVMADAGCIEHAGGQFDACRQCG